MRFKREASEEKVEEKDQVPEDKPKDQNHAISTSIRDLNYKLKYFKVLIKT